jgi:hypothetical protein
VTEDRSGVSIENQNIEILVRNIAKWVEINTSTEEFKAYKRQQIGYTLTDEWEHRLAQLKHRFWERQVNAMAYGL